ncbi:hypothetical protein LP7551_04938 [Roseibium album]|nr:hypothetical protein LP7551_04938 [Roseibium album]
MHELIETYVPLVIVSLELTAGALLVIGFCVATVIWARDTLGDRNPEARTRYRSALGRTILIGLEVLVAATIIKTVTLTPTMESMGTLLAIILIRTVLGWTTSLEIYGRWPWQPGSKKTAPDG